MTVSQTQFRDAILDASHPTPDGLIDGQGRPAGSRFSVYRNNVAVGLTDALAANFPAIEKLLGVNNFKAITGVFLRKNLPPTPLIINYGIEFPEFLASFEPLNHIGYLADVARVELAILQSFNAANTVPIDPAMFASIPHDALLNIRMTFAPTLRIIRSSWPIHAIWKMNTTNGAPDPPAIAQDVMITRPDFDSSPHLVPSGAAVFIIALGQNHTLGEAHEFALNSAPDFDLATTLGLLLQGQAITNLQTIGPAQ